VQHFRTQTMRVLLTVVAAALLLDHCRAEDVFENAPVTYSSATPKNTITDLQTKLSSGELNWTYVEGLGYLPAILQALNISPKSQTLVFSKTSMQRQRISPRTPRAIYFSDDVYVGFCQAGTVLEISAVDPQLGAVFYTLEQEKADVPRLTRQTESCLTCHASSRTENIPGHVVRSLFADRSGEPIFSAGSYSVDHRTPLEQRWGGWYVTGTHGTQRHLGNLIVDSRPSREPVENDEGQNLTELGDRFSPGAYLSPHSDIVALMVLEHQTLVQNRITRANFETRAALYYQAEMNRALGDPADKPLESVARRIHGTGDKLIEALLLVDEAELKSEIVGTSGFAEEFPRPGPRDSHGRSLRDLDLKQRLFKYPCSYLIYSEAFDALPNEVRSYVWQRLRKIFTGQDDSKQFEHLSAADRQAILEILRETKTDLPADWK